ncbi:MAG: hypothetical protein R3212_11415, partial [Xanthomonadales bacterium]|nr:hypothetical protein [Xanthomonadales bacterium]
ADRVHHRVGRLAVARPHLVVVRLDRVARDLLPDAQALGRPQGQGMDVTFEEARDAHNWENWRDRLRAGLTLLFPGPLWMIYE